MLEEQDEITHTGEEAEDNYEHSSEDDFSGAYATQLIQSAAKTASGTGRNYKDWSHARAEVRLDLNKPSSYICIDTGCSMSLVDRDFLAENSPAQVQKLTTPVIVRGIGSRRVPSTEYAIVDMYSDGTTGRKR
jgi:hypothetical protein